MRLDQFKQSKAGAVVGRLFADRAIVAEMLSEPHRRPPVGVLQRHLRAARLDLSHPERQHVGRWTAQVLGDHGLKPIQGPSGTKRAPVKEPGPLTSGALYERERKLTVEERWAKARAILAPYLDRMGTVDDFLRERRAMWGED